MSDLPPDVANGVLFTLLKNLQRDTTTTTVAYVAITPKPRLIHLEISPQGQEPFSSGSYRHRAIHYVMKVKIGGVAGVVAPLVGKQPPDTQAWILGDDAPVFVKSEGPLYGDGPIWRMELHPTASEHKIQLQWLAPHQCPWTPSVLRWAVRLQS
jgi:hypothetical protein